MSDCRNIAHWRSGNAADFDSVMRGFESHMRRSASGFIFPLMQIAFTGGNLVITLPAGSYNNGEKYCIVIAQSIPETTTINAPVVIQIGTGTTLYPLQNRCCAQVTACGVRTRTKYATRVATSATGGVFKMLGNPACSPNNNLTAINGTAPTADTPVTQAVRKGAL